MSMRTLTNNLADCDLLNLETGQNRRGPYVVRQDGVAPGSMDLRSYRFLLRKDGTWVNNLAVFVLPEAEQEAQFTFETIAEVYALANALGGRPRVEAALPEGKSPEELIAAAKSTTSRVWSRIQSARGSKPR
jgi:nucleotide-binding universal stress UspA family protein